MKLFLKKIKNIFSINNCLDLNIKILTPAEDINKGVDETNRETGMNLRKSWDNPTLSAYNTQFYFKSSAKDLESIIIEIMNRFGLQEFSYNTLAKDEFW